MALFAEYVQTPKLDFEPEMSIVVYSYEFSVLLMILVLVQVCYLLCYLVENDFIKAGYSH